MRARHLLLLLPLLLLPACATDRPAAPPPPVEAAGPVRQGNYDADRQVVAVPVRNTGDRTLTVTSVQLDSSRFRRVDPAAREDPIRPGQVVSLRLPYGTAVCPAPADAHEDAVLQVRVEGGAVRTARLAEATPSALDEMHAEQCRQQEVAAGFDIALTATGEPVLRGGKPTLPGLLTVRRTSSRKLRSCWPSCAAACSSTCCRTAPPTRCSTSARTTAAARSGSACRSPSATRTC